MVAAGTVQSVSSVSHTTLAVGPSSAYPSEETQSTSSTPARRAQRRAALLTAYDVDLMPAGSQLSPLRAAAGTPSGRVATVIPFRRAAREAAGTSASVA